MKERPILFSAPMVRAILNGTKTQTRRVVSLREFQASTTQGYDYTFRDKSMRWHDYRAADFIARKCPFGSLGDRLWVKETFTHAGRRTVYRATDPEPEQKYYPGEKIPMKWTPSIFMPRSESRISLNVTDVRVERLQNISGEDALVEGVDLPRCPCEVCSRSLEMCPADQSAHILEYATLWDSINGKRPGYTWSDNPWVWVVSFEVST